eukprot:CAMPEP_0174868856 /NCGR_PEP_ID=MMETSP1114-20130205/66786_1 /TAXON_ID=312471 /ORGANISM="Neobodo designis, Strain CCAP 1951/1" /LENGTH=148 /DNA_ID=CAMNT_0016104085 /DNA_START=1 /DNA_END=444 /DNA_ORIENTATION=+
MVAPVDDDGVFYIADPAAAAWAAQCFTHARRRIEAFARRAALGDHAFALAASQRARSSSAVGPLEAEDDTDDLMDAFLINRGDGDADGDDDESVSPARSANVTPSAERSRSRSMMSSDVAAPQLLTPASSTNRTTTGRNVRQERAAAV